MYRRRLVTGCISLSPCRNEYKTVLGRHDLQVLVSWTAENCTREDVHLMWSLSMAVRSEHRSALHKVTTFLLI